MRYEMFPVTRELWAEIVANCPYATPFHTPGWAEIWERLSPRFQAQPLGFAFADGARAILPMVRRKIPLGIGDWNSNLPGVYGGPISAQALNREHWLRIYGECSRRRPANVRLRMTGNPYSPVSATLPTGYRALQDYTQILLLGPGSDAHRTNYSRGHRSGLNKGLRAGLTVAQGKGPQDLAEYNRIYRQSLHRWGGRATSRYPERLLADLVDQPFARLWLVRSEGKVLAGAIVLYQGERAFYWHGAACAESFKLRPNVLLHDSIMDDARLRGCKTYDFNPSGGHAGVADFKARFGTKKLPFLRYSDSGLLSSAIALARRLTRKH